MILTAKLFNRKLKSPLILGSGSLGERKENLIKALKCGAGAVVNRTLRVDNSKRVAFKPAYHMEEHYMLNADNNNSTPWEYWVENAKNVERHGPLIISLSARKPKDCSKIVSAFEKNYSPSFYELNFSCPHSARLYGKIGYNKVEESLREIKKRTDKPVFLKMSLNNMNFKNLRNLESKRLVDAYVLSNTIGPGLKIDVKTRKPILGSVFGGVSGPAIKPLVLAGIHDLKQNTDKNIIGSGGIENAEDVLEYLILGCDAVQIYTKAHRDGLEVFKNINRELEKLLKEMNESVESIKGSIKI